MAVSVKGSGGIEKVTIDGEKVKDKLDLYECTKPLIIPTDMSEVGRTSYATIQETFETYNILQLDNNRVFAIWVGDSGGIIKLYDITKNSENIISTTGFSLDWIYINNKYYSLYNEKFISANYCDNKIYFVVSGYYNSTWTFVHFEFDPTTYSINNDKTQVIEINEAKLNNHNFNNLSHNNCFINDKIFAILDTELFVIDFTNQENPIKSYQAWDICSNLLKKGNEFFITDSFIEYGYKYIYLTKFNEFGEKYGDFIEILEEEREEFIDQERQYYSCCQFYDQNNNIVFLCDNEQYIISSEDFSILQRENFIISEELYNNLITTINGQIICLFDNHNDIEYDNTKNSFRFYKYIEAPDDGYVNITSFEIPETYFYTYNNHWTKHTIPNLFYCGSSGPNGSCALINTYIYIIQNNMIKLVNRCGMALDGGATSVAVSFHASSTTYNIYLYPLNKEGLLTNLLELV